MNATPQDPADVLWTRDPDDYDGDPICPRCGSGFPCCADEVIPGVFFRHDDTCRQYNWAADVCDECRPFLVDEDSDS